MKIIKQNSKDWEEKRGYSKKIFLTPEDLDSPTNLVQEIKIKPGEECAEHYHKKQTEVFYFLNANGYWIINGVEQRFEKGDVLVIEPHDKHKIINDTQEDYLYIAFKVNYVDDADSYWE